MEKHTEQHHGHHLHDLGVVLEIDQPQLLGSLRSARAPLSGVPCATNIFLIQSSITNRNKFKFESKQNDCELSIFAVYFMQVKSAGELEGALVRISRGETPHGQMEVDRGTAEPSPACAHQQGWPSVRTATVYEWRIGTVLMWGSSVRNMNRRTGI